MTSLALTLLTAGGAFAPAQTWGSAPEEDEGITVNLKEMEVRDVLATLAATRGLNIVCGPQVSGEVTVNLTDVSLQEALRAILLVNGLTYVERDGVIYVTRSGSPALRGPAWVETVTFRLDYADAEELVSVVAQLLSQDGLVKSYLPNRTVVVQDTPETIDRIRGVVAALDVPPRQVLIGARILEIRLEDELSFGVDWAALFRLGELDGDLSTVGFSPAAGPDSRGFFATLNTSDVDAFLDALDDMVEFEALAAPQVLALEGKEAEIIVGGKLGYYVTTTTQTSTMQSVQFMDIGSLLVITPTISDDGHVILDLHPKVSDGVVDNGLPAETTTEVTTSVLVADGETVFIGGLLRRREQTSQQLIPGLGQIPGLGYVFGRLTDSTRRTEVVVLITPRVTRPGDPQAITPLQLEPEPGPQSE